jgi:hypothetical protein
MPGYPESVRFDEDGPSITAVMVTGKNETRLPFARNAILSFLAQDYGNRHLLMVNDGPFSFEFPGLPKERFVELRPSSREVVGALRNRALDYLPEGALWVGWDDDDWHHPKLMSTQRLFLEAASAEACFLQNQVKYDFQRNTAWVDFHPGGFAGTIMSRQDPELRYPCQQRSEDSHFCHAIKQSRSWFAWDNPPRFYLRLLHRDSNWRELHAHFATLHGDGWQLPTKSAIYLKQVLEQHDWGKSSDPISNS